MCRAPTLDEYTNLQSPRLQPVLCQSPTWTSRGSNPIFPRHQPCHFEAPTFRAPTLSLVQALTWSLEDSYPLGLQPFASIRQDKFTNSSWVPISSATSRDNIFTNVALNWSPIFLVYQWKICLHMKVSPQLFMSPKQRSPKSPHEGLQQCIMVSKNLQDQLQIHSRIYFFKVSSR